MPSCAAYWLALTALAGSLVSVGAAPAPVDVDAWQARALAERGSRTKKHGRTKTLPPKQAPTTDPVGGGAPPDPNADLIATSLAEHNRFRALWGAQPLVWDTTLEAFAQNYANQCIFEHGANNQYGENLAIDANGVGWNVTDMIVGWENESPDYDPNNPQGSHFTQMVWEATTNLGCGYTVCPPGSMADFDPSLGVIYNLVCEYSPPGNVDGDYAANVGTFQGPSAGGGVAPPPQATNARTKVRPTPTPPPMNGGSAAP